jgi:hypothetical protein
VAAAIDVPPGTVEQLAQAHRSRATLRRPRPTEDPDRKPARAASKAVPPARRKALRDLIDVCLNRPSLIEERHVERLPSLLVEESEGVRELLLKLVHRAWIDPEASPGAIMSVVEEESHRTVVGSLIRDAEDQRDLRPQLEGALRYLENGLLEREIHTLADTVMLTGSDDALRLLSETKLRSEELKKRAPMSAEEEV